jgi:hypothetical protein
MIHSLSHFSIMRQSSPTSSSYFHPSGTSNMDHTNSTPAVGSAAVAVAAALAAAASVSNQPVPAVRSLHHQQAPGGPPRGGPLYMKLLVPERLAGVIIGKGGAGIVELESRTGCNVRLSANRVYFPGTSERVMVITSPDILSMEKIIPIIVSRLNAQTSSHDPSPIVESGTIMLIRLILTNTACSCLIGKGGEAIKSLCQHTGAMIRASDRIDHPPSQERIVEIKGSFDSVIAAARDIVLEKIPADMSFKESAMILNYPQLNSGGGAESAYYYPQAAGGGTPQTAAALAAAAGAAGAAQAVSMRNSIGVQLPVGLSAMVDQYPITIKFSVPSHAVGAIIGKNGETRTRIVHTTGANMVVSDRTADILADREISISGPLAAVQAALTLVAKQIVEAQ